MGMFGALYNTPLSDKQRQLYSKWLLSLPEYQRNTNDYDMQGAFLAGLGRGGNGHFPDTFKKPNHMTFSNESMYSTPEANGGTWAPTNSGNYVFWASPTNLRYNQPVDLVDYFKRNEPDQTLVLPIDYRVRR